MNYIDSIEHWRQSAMTNTTERFRFMAFSGSSKKATRALLSSSFSWSC